MAAVAPARRAARDMFAPARLANLLTVRPGSGVEHVLVSDGWRHLRLDLRGGHLSSGPFTPCWRLDGLLALEPQVPALRRLLAVARAGRFATRLWPRDPRNRRWTLALRAHDALAAGLGQRALAELLSGEDLADASWRTQRSSLRLQAQRLAALATSLTGLTFARRFL